MDDRCYPLVYAVMRVFVWLPRKNPGAPHGHTYSKELMHKNIDESVDAMFQIYSTLLRREPAISRWQGYHMANTDKWYYAYTFDGETVTVVDACHAQNMHE